MKAMQENFNISSIDLSSYSFLEEEDKKETSSKAITCKCCNNPSAKVLSSKGDITLHECDVCGFVFTDGDEQEPAIIAEACRPSKPFQRAEVKEYMKQAMEWIPQRPLEILNIGVGNKKLNELLEKRGHQVKSLFSIRETGQSDIKDRSKDLIITCNVFSNVTEPVQVFETLFNKVKEFGFLVIYTDMHASKVDFIEKLKNNELDMSQPYSFFRYKTLEHIIDHLGHEIVYVNPKLIMARKR